MFTSCEISYWKLAGTVGRNFFSVEQSCYYLYKARPILILPANPRKGWCIRFFPYQLGLHIQSPRRCRWCGLHQVHVSSFSDLWSILDSPASCSGRTVVVLDAIQRWAYCIKSNLKGWKVGGDLVTSLHHPQNSEIPISIR